MRLFAHFTPQAWVNDYAVTCDAEGESRWDVTDFLRTLSPERRRAMMEQDTHDSDQLRDLDCAPAWVRAWSGPFYVRVEAEPECERDRALLGAVETEDVFDYEDAGEADGCTRFRHCESGEVIESLYRLLSPTIVAEQHAA